MSASRLFAAVVGVALLLAVPTPAVNANAERVASECMSQHSAGWVSYTQAQTFNPTVSQIVRAEVPIGFLEEYHGVINARLVYRPPADVAGFGAPGVTVASMATEVHLPRGIHWVHLTPPAPVDVVANPAQLPAYSLEIDFPIDMVPGPASFKYIWMKCDGFKEGRAYTLTGAAQMGRVFADAGDTTPVISDGTLGQSPVVGPYQLHGGTVNFQYRIIGR